MVFTMALRPLLLKVVLAVAERRGGDQYKRRLTNWVSYGTEPSGLMEREGSDSHTGGFCAGLPAI